MKAKRAWSAAAKAAAKARMEQRWAAKREESGYANTWNDAFMLTREEVAPTRSPEVQAVINGMDPVRKAKLAGMQAKQWAKDAVADKATREALERHEAEKARSVGMTETAAAIARGAVFIPTATTTEDEIIPPVIRPEIFKTPSHPFRFTSGANGLMISELGECLCGEKKLSWHPICLKVKAHV